MRDRRTTARILMLFAALPLSCDSPSLSISDVAERARPATVTILTLSAAGDTVSQGSGFLIQEDGVVVTNWHVLKAAHSAVVILDNEEALHNVAYLAGDSLTDVAVLRVVGQALPILETTTDLPAVGERVVAVGSPLGLSQTVSEGILSAVRVFEGREWAQISAPISPGSSGGPVLDDHGRAFALATSSVEAGQQLNFAVPVRYAEALLERSTEERPLSEVFAQYAPSLPGVASRGGPPLAAQPRDRLNGVYAVVRKWLPLNDAAEHLRDIQDTLVLLLADGDTGWLILGDPAENIAEKVAAERTGLLADIYAGYSFDDLAMLVTDTYVAAVERVVVNSDGQVLVRFEGDFVLEGYQTADGFYAQSEYSEEQVSLWCTMYEADSEQDCEPTTVAATVTYEAVRVAPALSQPLGLYSVSMELRPQKLPRVDWSGEAAVVVVHDSIFIDLSMANSLGGGIAASLVGPLDSAGYFDLTGETAAGIVGLQGYIRPGELVGDWIDIRGGVSLAGVLEGRRQ